MYQKYIYYKKYAEFIFLLRTLLGGLQQLFGGQEFSPKRSSPVWGGHPLTVRLLGVSEHRKLPPAGRDRFQRERLGTAFPKLFSQWERRSQEFNSSLIIRYTFWEHAATYAIIRNSP